MRFLCREGLPGDEIVRAAGTLDTELIVMGSHGRRGLEQWILGSHADRVLRMAPYPVLVVGGAQAAMRAGAPLRVQEVVCAASASERAPRTADYARCLAARAGARLTLLHVAGPGWLSPRSEILRCARKRGADLIVIGAHDRGPFSTLRHLGATSDGVVRQAECGVLIVPPPAARTGRSTRITAPAEAAV